MISLQSRPLVDRFEALLKGNGRWLNNMDNESKVRGAGIRGAGGTPGGIGEFVIGLAMTIAGAYMLTNRVVVASGFWSCGVTTPLVLRYFH